MSFSSIMDIYLVSIGMLSYNILYNICVDSGLIYFPIIYVLISETNDAIESGRTSNLLRKLEVKIISMFVCFSLTFVPVIDYKISDFKTYTRMCELDGTKVYFDEKPEGFRSSEAKNALLQVSGYDLKVPLLLGYIYNLGNGFAFEAVDRLPCSINITAFHEDMMNAEISDPNLMLETKAFLKTCYYPAKIHAIRRKDLSIPWIYDPDGEVQPWAGSEHFFNKHYYENVAEGFYSRTLLDGYKHSPNNENISAWTNDEGIQEIGGFPTCREWWNGVGDGFPGVFRGGAKGLRHHLVENLKEYTKGNLEPYENLIEMYSDVPTSKKQRENELIRVAYFNQYNISKLEGAEVVTDYSERSDGAVSVISEHVTRAAGTVGTALDAFPSYSGASMIQLGAPIMKGIMLMVFIALAPLGSIASNFGFKFIVPFYFFLFSLTLWPYLFELSLLTQQSLVDETLGEGFSVNVAMNPNIAMLGTTLTDLLFVIIPSLLTSMLTLAGIGLHAVSGATDKPGSDVGSAGKNGGKSAQGGAKAVGKAVATKGMSKGKE